MGQSERDDLRRRIFALLAGGHATDRLGRERLINELGEDGLEVLRAVAAGRIEAPHPKLQLKAIAALGFDRTSPEASMPVLADLAERGQPRTAVQAVRALGQLSRGSQQLRDLVRDQATPPAVALAAARIVAQLGGDDVVAELEELRRRLLRLTEDERSPSILSIERAIEIARGEYVAEGGPEPIP